MNARLCDTCKKVLPENDIKYCGIFMQRFELCEECNKTAQMIKAEYETKEDELQQTHKLLVKTIIDEFKKGDIWKK